VVGLVAALLAWLVFSPLEFLLLRLLTRKQRKKDPSEREAGANDE
jgi:hypothetical protein